MSEPLSKRVLRTVEASFLLAVESEAIEREYDLPNTGAQLHATEDRESNRCRYCGRATFNASGECDKCADDHDDVLRCRDAEREANEPDDDETDD